MHLICRAEKNKLLKNKFFRYSQVLFPKGNLIKYVHQLSQYQVGFEKNKQQLINVVALNHNLKKKISNFYLVSKKLEEYGLIPKSEKRRSEDFYWQDILIPQITTEDLNQITKKTENVVSFFSTECMNTAFGDYCENWNFPKGLFYIT